MAQPNLPLLAANVVTVTNATTTIPDALNAINSALTATTYDNGSSVPANAQHTTSVKQATGVTEAILATPPASSPLYGKVVYVWAGSNVSTHASTAMLSPDTYVNNRLFFGKWVAKPGQTVALSDYNAWDAASPFNGSNGFFTGYSSLGGTAITWTKTFLFTTAEYIVTQIETAAAAGTYACGFGAGIRAPTTAAADSTQSDGRVYDMWTSGGSAVIPVDFWTTNFTTASLFTHDTTASSPHFYYMAPLATAMRACGYKTSALALGYWPSNANAGLALSGAVAPETMAIKDFTGGATNARDVGRHRMVMFGARRITKTVLSTGGVNVGIAFSWTSTTSGDAALFPMG